MCGYFSYVNLSHPAVYEPIDCSPQPCPWNSPGQNTGVGGHFPSPGDLPNLGIKLGSPALHTDFLPVEPQGKPKNTGVGELSLF